MEASYLTDAGNSESSVYLDQSIAVSLGKGPEEGSGDATTPSPTVPTEGIPTGIFELNGLNRPCRSC